MGEGWGDIFGVVLTTKPSFTRKTNRPVGNYALPGLPLGIRQAPYSTDMKVNNLKYSSVSSSGEVHDLGTIWASMLFEVYWNLVDKLGFAEDMMASVNSGKGNTVFLQLFISGMKLQPCSPTFLQARDAFVEADRLKNGGANKCEIWRGFAKRGLGTKAKTYWFYPDDDFSVPADC